MKVLIFTMMLMGVFGSSAFGDSPNRTCASWGCKDLYAWIAADAIMALPGSAEMAMFKDEGKKFPYQWQTSESFVDGVKYAFCTQNNPTGCSWEKRNSNSDSWKQGEAAAVKIIILFQSEEVGVDLSMTNKIRDVIYIYRDSKELGWKFPQKEEKKKEHLFNDNSSLSLEENIKTTIASAKKMIEDWDSKKDERKTAQKAKEKASKFDITEEGYRGLSWGMSLEEAKKLKPNLINKYTYNENILIEGNNRDIEYYFERGYLYKISIQYYKLMNHWTLEKICSEPLEEFNTKFGKPHEREDYRKWIFGNTSITLYVARDKHTINGEDRTVSWCFIDLEKNKPAKKNPKKKQ